MNKVIASLFILFTIFMNTESYDSCSTKTCNEASNNTNTESCWHCGQCNLVDVISTNNLAVKIVFLEYNLTNNSDQPLLPNNWFPSIFRPPITILS
jgi:hypothetical protein